jgi:Ni/Co efflux regulator RcnB
MRIPAVLLALAAFALFGESLAVAQQQQQTTQQQSTTTRIRTQNSQGAQNRQRRHDRRYYPYTTNVIIDSGMVRQMLATATPKPPPGSNKVNAGGQVFKSIGN